MASCERCSRGFGNDRALQQHKKDSSAHHICDDCGLDHSNRLQLIMHWTESSRHHYCRRCDTHFGGMNDLSHHYEQDHYYCALCSKVFDLDSDIHEHRRTTHPASYCALCKRMFRFESNLDHHTRSSAHQPKGHHCPGHGCNKSFISVAALVHHWESGACRSGVTREIVDRGAATLDARGIVTNHARFLEGPDSPGERILDDIVTKKAWNGRAYECCICHRTYQSLGALNAHLQSPAHSQKIYRCPLEWKGCGQEFKVISAFCQHIESGVCGVIRFRRDNRPILDQTQDVMTARTSDEPEPSTCEIIVALLTLVLTSYGLYYAVVFLARSRYNVSDIWQFFTLHLNL
ncbi:hypothetical protein OBBRIDRAFT_80325 [Obba rivulosa]|uniref:C2H2-type domain-containing protein n=1 Tax=Obba rivulosa TaxID=1052685 RepID=A0A8E2AXQ4_9APHY|nr:hypothetical protein OBBRIDRAFT_80325 [Obba rivulosa]